MARSTRTASTTRGATRNNFNCAAAPRSVEYEALGALQYEDLAGDVMIDWAQLERPLPTKENLAAAKVAAE